MLRMMDFNESWVQLYQTALTELEHAKMTGRISAAKGAIFARLLKLNDLPGLHEHEKESISDALRSLSFLESEEKRFEGQEKRRLLDEALGKLRRIAPAIERLGKSS